jgi:spore maturation protein CgeB
LKIFLSFLQSSNKHPIPAYDYWQFYLKNGIEEAGYEWVEHPDIDWAFGLMPQSADSLSNWKDETWNKTISWLKENPVDLFLSYLYPEQVDTNAITEIKKMGIPCVNFFCDNVRQFKVCPIQYSVFDLNWVPEHKAIKMYADRSYSHINLPMPVWIAHEYREPQKERNSQITFLGSSDIQRLLFFEEVVNKEPSIELNIYGGGWDRSPQQNQFPTNSSIAKKITNQFNFISEHGARAHMRKIARRNKSNIISDVLSSKSKGGVKMDTHNRDVYNKLSTDSMITVGVNRYPSFHFPLHRPDTYSRLRDIEAPMLGACYLTEYTEGLEQLYELDKEIAVYNNADDFIEKVKALSVDSSLRQTLRSGGQRRALTEHSIPRSINKIIDWFK